MYIFQFSNGLTDGPTILDQSLYIFHSHQHHHHHHHHFRSFASTPVQLLLDRSGPPLLFTTMLENNFWSNLSGSNHVDMPAHCQLAYATSSYAPHHNHTTTNNPHHHHHHQGTQHSHQHQHQQHHHHYHQQQHQQQQHQNYLLNASPFSMCHDLASPIAAVEPLNRYNNNNNNNYNAYSASGHSWAADYQNKYSTSGNYLIADAVADFNGNHETSGNTPAGCLYSLASDDSHTFNICPSSSSTSSNSNSSSNSSTSSTGSTNTKVATGNSRKRPNRTNDGSSEQQQQHQHQQQRKKVSDVGDSKTAAKSGNCVGRRERTTANKAVSASMSKRNTSEQNESLIATMAAASEKSDKKSPKSTSSSPATRTPTNHSNHGVSVDGCTPFSTFFDPTTLQYQHQHQQRRFSPGQRQVANQRERDRTHSVNSAFLLLRSLIPTEPLDRKLSKIETLRLAGSYIHHLSSILNTPDEFSHEPCLFMQR